MGQFPAVETGQFDAISPSRICFKMHPAWQAFRTQLVTIHKMSSSPALGSIPQLSNKKPQKHQIPANQDPGVCSLKTKQKKTQTTATCQANPRTGQLTVPFAGEGIHPRGPYERNQVGP